MRKRARFCTKSLSKEGGPGTGGLYLEEGGEEERQVAHEVLVLCGGGAVVCALHVCALGHDGLQHVDPDLEQIFEVHVVLLAHTLDGHLHSWARDP